MKWAPRVFEDFATIACQEAFIERLSYGAGHPIRNQQRQHHSKTDPC